MEPVNHRILAAFGITFQSVEEEKRFIEAANERFMVQVGAEISKAASLEQIQEYLMQCRTDSALRAQWIQNCCPSCQEVICRVWQSFCKELCQMQKGSGQDSLEPDSIEPE